MEARTAAGDSTPSPFCVWSSGKLEFIEDLLRDEETGVVLEDPAAQERLAALTKAS